MKMNFWQWLGVIVLLIVVPIYLYRHFNPPKSSTNSVVVGTPDTGNEAKTEADFFETPTTSPAQ